MNWDDMIYSENLRKNMLTSYLAICVQNYKPDR